MKANVGRICCPKSDGQNKFGVEMMRYIFCSYMFPDAEKDIAKMKNPPTASSHKYMTNLLRGLLQNGQDVTVINTPRIRSFPNYPGIWIHQSPFILDGEKLGINAGYIHLPLFSYITRMRSIRRELKKEIGKHHCEPVVIISFNSFFPVSSSMIYAKRKFKNILLCGVIGDLSGNNGANNQGKGIRWRIFKALEKRAEELSKQFDAFGFLTKYMAEALELTEKPYCVIEGMYSGKSPAQPAVEMGAKQIFYAGEISENYGIIHLLAAFSFIQGSEYQLILAGLGNAVEDVKRYASKDERIVYLGYITPSEVERYQQSATVLVNPRTSEHSFVKYSFPSKNMECLASGKPYIAHDLICNPEEYRDYIQYPADESDQALAQKIVEVCRLPKEKRDEIGERARQFILTQKNPKAQCKKIIDMMNHLKCGK